LRPRLDPARAETTSVAFTWLAKAQRRFPSEGFLREEAVA